MTTVSITWMTPFDWYTSAMVTFDVPPYSSVSETPFIPFMRAVSVPPLTVLSMA